MAPDERAPEAEDQPRGTMALLLGYLLLIAVMWGFTYWLLLDWG